MRVQQGEIHKEIQWHIEECRRRGLRFCGILAPWGHGKCFVKGTKINLSDGQQIPIEEFSDQKLFDESGYHCQPSWHGFVGYQETIKITFTSGRFQQTTIDHPFLTNKGFIQAQKLKPNDRVRLVAPIHEKGIFYSNAWLAGLYIGDGSYGKISCSDKNVIDCLSKLGELTKVGPYEYYLKGIGKLLKDVGISDRKKKTLPNLRLFSDKSIADFLAGWFDADGTVTIIPKYRKRKDGSRYQKARIYRVELYSINRDWLVEAQYALLRLGIHSVIYKKNGRYKGQSHVSWRLSISGKEYLGRFRRIVPMVSLKSMKLDDKAISKADLCSAMWDGVRSVEPCGMNPCYGFTMPRGVHSIDGIVSHNTEQVVIGRALSFLGENRNYRIQIICNTDENAKSRVAAISKYIEQDEDYHLIYPDVKPDYNAEWTKHKIMVQRESFSKDGSIEAWGITTSGTGSRADIQIYDDPVDMRNAILNPALRLVVKESMKNVWLSRLVEDGFAIYIATVWHNDDLTHEIMANPEWNFLVMKVSEDFSCIECESCFKNKYNIPLWTSKWSSDKLKQQARVIGNKAFDRGYRQKALSDEDKTFPSSYKIFRNDVGSDFIQPDWARCVGIDPFGQFVVIFVLALSTTGTRFVLEVKRGKWSPTRTIDEIISVYDRHMPQIIVCENNAAQEAIVQWAQERASNLGRSIVLPIVPFTTGAQKANPILGLPSMEVEFFNGAWVAPMRGVDPFDAEHGFNIWKKELDEHPIGTTADTVMASWFAREGARYIGQEKPDTDGIIAGEDVGVEEVRIGGYD